MLTKWRRHLDNDVKVMTSTVRYRLLVLMLLPVLVTLASLVFITIYWNLTYTGNQLFMKVRADLAVAQGILEQQAQMQENSIQQTIYALDFAKALSDGGDSELKINRLLERHREQQGLDFLRFVTLEQGLENIKISQLFPKGLQPRSGIQVLTRAQLLELSPALARQASILLKSTPMAAEPGMGYEQRGMLVRSLVPVLNERNERIGLLDGGVLLNHNTRLVDRVKSLIYGEGALPSYSQGTVTLFLDNVRISTNVPDLEGERVVGTLVSEQVRMDVLEKGEIWLDRAFVFDDWYISAYAPLFDAQGELIGMVYTGFTEAPFVKDYLINILEMGVMLLLVLLSSGWAVYRSAAGLLTPIDRIHAVVKAVQQGENRRIGDLDLDPANELAQLAQQFDLMLDQLQERNQQIQAAADQLEQKVQARTASLQARTQELKSNIQLLEETRQQMVTNEKLVALGELTAGIAHEINNPTAVILGNIELIKLELLEVDHDLDEEIELIVQQVQRINSIIQSLLQYARPGDLAMPLQRQSMAPILQEMLVLVRHSLRKQSVEVSLASSETVTVEVNRQQLLQVLINLVVNAAHALDGADEVRVTSMDWREGAQLRGVMITVADDGCGIAPEVVSRIFDPFFTTRKQGTGLGLSLSYGIIRRFGGLLEVESELGVGSVFTIKLPLLASLESREQSLHLHLP